VDATVVIFSYNRGRYLANAAASVRRHWPSAGILIVDDHSDDRKTLRVLDDERRRGAKVVRPETPASAKKRGGLHDNMQLAWERHLETRYALYMQDDQQIVRALDSQDEARFIATFDALGAPPFLHVVFPRCVVYQADDAAPPTAELLDGMRSAFDPMTATFDLPGMPGLSETGLWDVHRAKAAGWSFADDEAGNKARGREMFGAGRITATPFLAFLPAPLSYRNRRITLTRRAFFLLTSDVYPVDDLTAEQNAYLLTNIGEPPLGDQYLRSSSFGANAPWPALPMTSAPGWLVKLDVMEQKLRSRLGSVTRSLERRLRLSASREP
jgi:hypothetical protein